MASAAASNKDVDGPDKPGHDVVGQLLLSIPSAGNR
jgi:hypothetical protein